MSNRNNIIAEAIEKSGGKVTNREDRNQLLIDLLENGIGGSPSELYENQPTSAKLCIGKGLSGSGNLLGQVNDFVGGTSYLGSTTVNAIFNATREDLVLMPQVEFHAPIGEDAHPLITCSGGLDGAVVGGTSVDFKPVTPTE